MRTLGQADEPLHEIDRKASQEPGQQRGEDKTMVDMKATPFYLSDEDCKWVEDTIAGMSLDEKIGQLFFNMGSSREEE